MKYQYTKEELHNLARERYTDAVVSCLDDGQVYTHIERIEPTEELGRIWATGLACGISLQSVLLYDPNKKVKWARKLGLSIPIGEDRIVIDSINEIEVE